ncbi:MAG: RDD family protein [Azospira oryzae]|jgi:uncharacterized RDD family membrane protein YckC|nr:RDD family protein [Cytophaga sp.]PZR41044.1 MAG: RDD family protein [Azospira oryzae]
MQTIKVRTTQNVFIHYPVASVGDRILAFLLDRLILLLYCIALIALFISSDMEVIWIWLIMIGVPFLFYHLFFEIVMDGQSPGKRAMRIKVIRMDGTPASIGDYLLRWIFSFVDYYILSGVIAVIIVAAGGKGQRLGDLVAGTSVIKLIEQKEITAEEVFITAAHEYTPVFSQVVHLSERDIELIQRALEVYRDQQNIEPVMAVTERIKSLLGVQTDLTPVNFLYTVVKDFQHITSR